MLFIYDPEKDQSNIAKHGIGFEEAKSLWDDKGIIEIPAHKQGEKRRMVIARMDNTFWSAIITYRGKAIRIISVRRSTKKEIDFYGKSHQDNCREPRRKI